MKLKKYKYYIAYGAGKNYEHYRKYCSKAGFNIDYIADIKWKDSVGCDQYYGDVNKITFDEINELENALIIVFILNEKVYSEVRNVFSTDVCHILEIYTEYMMNMGICIAAELDLLEEEYSDKYYFIFRGHLGDTVFLLPYISLFKEVHTKPDSFLPDGRNIKHRESIQIHVLTTKSNKGVCRLCKYIDEIHTYTEEQLEALSFYVKSNPHFRLKNIFCDALCDSLINEPQIIGIHECFLIYNLPYNDKSKGFLSKYRACVNDESIRTAREIIDQNSSDSTKKKVIICPYAKSTAMLDEKFWGSFVDKIKYKADIYTNVVGSEKPITGTQGLTVDVDIMCALSTLGVTVIGVQSGIMDVLTQCAGHGKLLVIRVARNHDDLKILEMWYGKIFDESDETIQEMNNVSYMSINNTGELQYKKREELIIIVDWLSDIDN